MSQRKIITKTITQDTYVSADGRETPVHLMLPTHLVNAFGKAVQEENEPVIKSLKCEIIRRINAGEKA